MTTQERPKIASRFDPRAFPIAVKIVLGLSVALAISTLVTSQFVRQVVLDTRTEEALADLQTFSRSEAVRATDLLEQEITALRSLGDSSRVQEHLMAAQEISDSREYGGTWLPDMTLYLQLSEFEFTHQEFDGAALLDSNGYVLAVVPLPSDVQALNTPRSWAWFTGAYNGGAGATYLNNPEDDHLTDLEGIHIAIPVYDVSTRREIIGVLYGIWNLDNAIDVVQIGGTRQGFVLEPDGTVLISPHDEPVEAFPSELIQQIQQSGKNTGTLAFTYSDGQKWLFAYTKLADLELDNQSIATLNWIVLARQPFSAVEVAANRLVSRLQLALGISAALVMLVALFLSRSVLVPLGRLTDAATQIEAGDLSIPIPQAPADEIGQLASVLGSLVEQLLHRVRQLRAAVQVSRTAALTLDINQMLDSVAIALTKQFDYPEIRIYLADPGGRRLRLHAASGGESERLLRVGHRVAADETTLVGRAALMGEIQGSSGPEAPKGGPAAERSELAIPLQVGEQMLGVLYVFAGRNRTFSEEDADILRLLADQIGGSIENVRLFEQSAANLAEIEALNRQLTRQAWEEHLGEGEGLRHTLDPDRRWPGQLEAVRQRGSSTRAETYTDADGRSVLAAPLVLRGEAVGTLAVTRPAGELWTRDEVALLEAVANRMVTIAEGIRLVEESTQRARREQRVNEISANLLQRAASVDEILQTALDQLGGALGSRHLSLRIGPPPVEGDRRIASGSEDGRAEAARLAGSLSEPETGPGPDDERQKSGTGEDGGLSDDK
jgi:GAF domain-containing protein/HAMP domain-containing protein